MKKIFTLLGAAILSLVATASAQSIYLLGSGDGLSWESFPGKEVTLQDGYYTTTINNLTEFKFSKNKATGWDGTGQFNDGCYITSGSFGDAVLNSGGQTLNLTPGSDPNISAPWKGNYTIKIKEDFSTITLSTSTPKPTSFPDVYVRGDMNSWGTSANWKFSTEDGVTYTLKNVTINPNVGFKIADADWSAINFGKGSMAPTGTQNLTYNSANITLTQAFTGDLTFKIVSARSSATLTFSESGGEVVPTYPAKLYAIGNVNGNGFAENTGVEMTKVSDGVFELKGATLSNGGTSYFAFTANLGNWDVINAERYGPTSKDFPAVIGSNVIGMYGDTSYKLADGNYDFTVDLTKNTLTIAYAGGEITYPELYIRGSFTGTDWAASPEYKFTNEKNVYTLSGISIPANGEFKVANDSWGISFGGEGDYQDGVTVALSNGVVANAYSGGNNFIINEALKDVTVTFTYDPTGTSTILVKGTVDSTVEPEPEPELYLRGSFIGTEWSAEENFKMTASDNVYTISGVNIPADAQFKVGSSDWKVSYGGTGLGGDDQTPYTLTNGVEADAWKDSSINFTVAKAINNATVTLTVNPTGASKIKVEGTEETVDPNPGDIELNATFNCTTYETLKSYIPSLPAASAWPTDPATPANKYYNVTSMTTNGIVIDFDAHGATGTAAPKVYEYTGKYDLRCSANNTFTVTAPTGYNLVSIEFAGSASTASTINKLQLGNPAVGTLTDNSSTANGKKMSWAAGNNDIHSVEFMATGNVRYATIDVVLVEVEDTPTQTLTLTGEFAGVKDQGEGMGGITATIKWTLTGDPVIEDYNSAKVYYQLAKKGQTPSEVLQNAMHNTGDSYQATLNYLDAATDYVITAYAEYNGAKSETNAIEFSTNDLPPTITFGSYEAVTTETTADITFKYTTTNWKEGYSVKIYSFDLGDWDRPEDISYNGGESEGTLHITDLQPDKEYSYSVTLYVMNGDTQLANAESKIITFTTQKAQTLSITGEVDTVKDQGAGMGGMTAVINLTVTADPAVDFSNVKVYYQIVKKDETSSDYETAQNYGGGEFVIRQSFLEPTTEYVVNAYAVYDGTQSNTWSDTFTTPAPAPTITWGSYEAETTETTADITFKYTTTNWQEGYSVKIYAFDRDDWNRPDDINLNGGESEGTLNLTDLEPGKDYTFTVTLYVMNGATQLANTPSQAITFTTKEAAKDVVLTISNGQVMAQDRGSYGGATLSMNWEVTTDPQVEDASDVKLFYQVVKDGNSATEEWSEATYNYGSYRAEKTDLEYNTKYTVLAYAQYETFESAKWTYEITTPVASPVITWGDYSPSVTSNSATVTFNYTTTNWSDDYTVKIEAMDNETYASTFGTGNATTGTIEFTDLEPGTDYNYVVLLYVMKGNETVARTLGDGISFTTPAAAASLKLNESGVSYNVYPNGSVSFTVNESAITSENVADDAVIDVYYQLNGADSYTKAENNGRGSYTFDISGLNYQTQYQVNIYAATGEGTDMIKSNTVNVIFTTPAAQASVNVISVEESDVTSTTATVTVSVVSENVPEGGSVKVYLTDDNSINLEQTVAEGQQTATFNLTGLTGGTSYVLYASAQVLNSHDDVIANSMEMSVEINTPADVIPATVAIENATAAAEETTAVITVEYAANNIPEGAMIYAQAQYEIDDARTIVKTDSQAASEDGVVVVNLDNLTADTNYAVLINIYLTDADGNIIAGSDSQIVNFTTEASAITAIEAEMLEGVRYFDLNGHEIKRQPAPGIYIRVKDNQATKVIIK